MNQVDTEAAVRAALEHQKAGRIKQAEAIYQRVLEVAPEHSTALHYIGLLAQRRGSDAAALDFIRRSVAKSPGSESAQFHNNLAIVLGRLGRVPESMAALDRSLTLRPDYAEAWSNRGVALEKLGKLDESSAAFAKAIELKPDFVDGHVNLGNMLTKQGKDAEALAQFEKAAERFPNSVEIAINLGNAQRRAGQTDKAVASLRRAIERRPQSPEARNNLGVALHDAGLLPEAEVELRKALELRHDYADAHWNLSLVLLHRGNYHAGWMEYEWRRHLKEDGLSKRSFPQPPWSGGPLEGRRVLVLCEQGLGDTLQFIRYAKILADRGAKVILECQPRLENLLKGVPGIERVVARGEPLPPFDCHVRLLSLPGILGTTPETIPSETPYIRIDPAAVANWRHRLAGMGGGDAPVLRVGLAWQGNTAYRGDPQRSIPLAKYAVLGQIPGVQFFSLQKGHGSDQVAAVAEQLRVQTFDPPLDDLAGAFFDTAAVMLNLDLVITSDTSIAHLAGSLGVPTWIALPTACDWRWQSVRSDSPWYPSTRLFRQSKRGDWDGVFAQIKDALIQRASGQGAQAAGTAEVTTVAAGAAVPTNGAVHAPVSAGELLDKITILRIKARKISDPAKLANVRQELTALESVRAGNPTTGVEMTDLEAQLAEINEQLWEVEDEVRRCEAAGDFGPRFVELARSVCRHNDYRSALKRRVNELSGSAIVEEKSYASSDPV